MSFLIVGSGRVAQHMTHYLSLLNVSFHTWDRSQSPDLFQSSADKADKILLLISDDALQDFVDSRLAKYIKKTAHFSGATSIAGVTAIHPMMTFGVDLYDVGVYRNIPFVQFGDESNNFLDPLPNPVFKISLEQQQKYHSLCVLAGNYTQFLWKKFFESMSEIGIPKEACWIYMHQNFQNLLRNPQATPSGPLSRGDLNTIYKNLMALENDPYQQVYKSFVMAEKPEVNL